MWANTDFNLHFAPKMPAGKSIFTQFYLPTRLVNAPARKKVYLLAAVTLAKKAIKWNHKKNYWLLLTLHKRILRSWQRLASKNVRVQIAVNFSRCRCCNEITLRSKGQKRKRKLSSQSKSRFWLRRKSNWRKKTSRSEWITLMLKLFAGEGRKGNRKC